eukprot:m.92140 g.92140  ORF g.92140 m.92140 type:complete len:53 (-) comp21699_c0_seq1:48-206(-)
MMLIQMLPFNWEGEEKSIFYVVLLCVLSPLPALRLLAFVVVFSFPFVLSERY